MAEIEKKYKGVYEINGKFVAFIFPWSDIPCGNKDCPYLTPKGYCFYSAFLDSFAYHRCWKWEPPQSLSGEKRL